MPCPKSIASLETAVIKVRNDQIQDRLEDTYKNSSPAHHQTCCQHCQIAQSDEDDGEWVDMDSLHDDFE